MATDRTVIAHLARHLWRRARKAGVPYLIENGVLETMIMLTPDCPITGIKLRIQVPGAYHGPRDDAPTLMLMNAASGYVEGNVAVVSSGALRKKNDDKRRAWIAQQLGA